MKKALTFQTGSWLSSGKWKRGGKATIDVDMIGAIVDHDPGCEIWCVGLSITVNLTREEVLEAIRNAEVGRVA